MYKPTISRIISFIWDIKMVGKGCLAYLDHIRDVKVKSLSIDSIPVVSEF